MGILDYFRSTEKTAQEYDLDELEKTERKTTTVTWTFTRRHATITYPDQRTEDVEFTTQKSYDGHFELYDLQHDDFSLRIPYSRHTVKGPRFDIESSQPRMFSYANIQDMKVRWKETLVAVTDVEIDVTYRRRTPDHEWKKESISFAEDADPDSPDVTIWQKQEWENHKS